MAFVSVWSYRLLAGSGWESFRETLFNITSILTGTGYATSDYGLWGNFPLTVFLLISFIGGLCGLYGLWVENLSVAFGVAGVVASCEAVGLSSWGVFYAL